MRLISTYLICTVIFFAIDMLWLGVIARNFYREQLGFIFTGQVRWVPAIVFYLLYIGGILFFCVLPAQREASIQLALINGAVLGLLCYATYDLTNMATIALWPLRVVVIDIIWGVVLTSSVSSITYWLASRWN